MKKNYIWAFPSNWCIWNCCFVLDKKKVTFVSDLLRNFLLFLFFSCFPSSLLLELCAIRFNVSWMSSCLSIRNIYGSQYPLIVCSCMRIQDVAPSRLFFFFVDSSPVLFFLQCHIVMLNGIKIRPGKIWKYLLFYIEWLS